MLEWSDRAKLPILRSQNRHKISAGFHIVEQQIRHGGRGLSCKRRINGLAGRNARLVISIEPCRDTCQIISGGCEILFNETSNLCSMLFGTALEGACEL